MKTVFETIDRKGEFSVDILNEYEQTLSFKSTEERVHEIDFFFFILSKEEALNLAQHILKLYSKS